MPREMDADKALHTVPVPEEDVAGKMPGLMKMQRMRTSRPMPPFGRGGDIFPDT